jgi:predicted aspartyl protease
VNSECSASTLVDSGCLSYGLIDSRFTRKHNLQRIKISPRIMTGFNVLISGLINEVTVVQLDIGGHQERVFLYNVPRLAKYDMILGLPWMKKNDVRISPRKACLTIRLSGVQVRNEAKEKRPEPDYKMVSAAGFSSLVRQR